MTLGFISYNPIYAIPHDLLKIVRKSPNVSKFSIFKMIFYLN